MTDLSELEKLARAATPGPWVAENYVDEVGLSVIASDEADYISNPSRGQVCHVSVIAGATGDDRDGAKTNAAYIAAANPETILALIAERDALRAGLEEIEAERDEALDWAATVDRHGTDLFDALGDKWLSQTPIVRMFNAVASVFSRWANDDLMDRFKKHMHALVHQAFVEGCIVGCRIADERARQLLTPRSETEEG